MFRHLRSNPPHMNPHPPHPNTDLTNSDAICPDPTIQCCTSPANQGPASIQTSFIQRHPYPTIPTKERPHLKCIIGNLKHGILDMSGLGPPFCVVTSSVSVMPLVARLQLSRRRPALYLCFHWPSVFRLNPFNMMKY